MLVRISLTFLTVNTFLFSIQVEVDFISCYVLYPL